MTLYKLQLLLVRMFESSIPYQAYQAVTVTAISGFLVSDSL